MVNMIRSDLDFILAQIKIAEADARHDADPVNNPNVFGTLLPNSEVPWGLRRVDGSNNNLIPDFEKYGAAGEAFPRETPPSYTQGTGAPMAFGSPYFSSPGVMLSVPGVNGGTTGVPLGFLPPTIEADNTFGPGGIALVPNWLSNTQYGVPDENVYAGRAVQPGDVLDADPRIISNLIVDQTVNNPAAVFKALQDAGLDNGDAFGLLDAYAAAVQAVKGARANAASENAQVNTALNALNVAQTAYNSAIQNANADLGPTLSAYQEAVSAVVDLAAAIELAISTASALAAELTLGAFDPADTAAYTAAIDASNGLLAEANAVLAALESDPNGNVLADDLTAVQTLIGDITDNLVAGLATINVGNGITFLEDSTATSLVDFAQSLTSAGADLTAQLTETRDTIIQTDPNVAAAAQNLDQAELNYSAAVAEAGIANQAADDAGDALRELLELNGITLEEAPLAPNATTPDILKATLYIGNVAPDEGLSAPFNGWMTIFGQFFDHGLDLVAKGGYGTVYIPLQPDDPLYNPLTPNTNFMAVTRATLGPDGQPVNLVTPFVDQNQTYTSNASHQVFLREYELDGNGRPQATGRLLNGSEESGGGLATWADVKAQARDILGIELTDENIHHVPEVVVDAYGNFIPGANGFPQLVRSITGGVVEAQSGTALEPITTADGYVSTGIAFLDDIAHAANPDAGEVADSDSALGLSHTPSVPGERAYDNELLDAHYITGDGRGNENIALTAVHHVFHSEHNRQVDLIQELLVTDGDLAFLNEWLDAEITQDALDALNAITDPILKKEAIDQLDWNGERIFQAAKFPTEMQYQHLVFEEFARKVQPQVNLFNDYDGTLDPAILAEFAHTIYRFGHSMLTETVDRYSSDWQSIGSGGEIGGEQIGLIEAFLNPLEFDASGVTAEQAAGVIAQGMTRQRGSEIDEFVTEALRNNLVGLPLDLAAINIARARETGVPSLNAAREDFFSKSGDTQVKPYESWFEFMQNLKNPASLINFIAAYGTHDSITGADGYEAKRAAAADLVLGGGAVSDDERLDFLNARGAFAGDPDLGGLNDVDFWIGGLAEKKLIFGGMLGSTFNFVFEAQLEALQNGDRFYYLSRLANLNLTAQLENNKFSEMIHRNTTATHLPGDAFARPDFFLEADISRQFNAELGVSLDPTGTQIGIDPFQAGASGGGTNGAVIRSNVVGTVAGRLEYTGAEHVVLGGTAGNDWLIGGKGDDTLWGDGGDDRLEGGDGNDFIFGGDGNDIITDLFGIDEIRSGAGNDVVSAGRGIKLIITDTGNDWVWGGVDDDEVLAGQGDDFVNGGDGADFLIGGEGNDWLESGTENGLMLGDNGDLVQGLPIKRSVDSRIVGNDVLLATGGNADFDAETGDDIMVGGLGTDRFFGQFGFDWATYKNDPFGLEADMNNRLFAPPSLPASPGAILDRYAQTEALSGSANNDILRGDDIADLAGGGEGAVVDGLDHALYDFNVDLVAGLDQLLGTINETGEVRFSAGNILLGGSSSDIIEGRGGNDVIDGDSWLNVRIGRFTEAGVQIETFNTMDGYQQRVLSGEIKVAELKIVREILDDNDAIDIAEFSGVRADYRVEDLGDGFVTVTHLVRDAAGDIVVGQVGTDGVDKLKNIERLLFSDQTIKITEHANSIATGVPVISDVDGTLFATLPATTATDADGVANPIVFYWQVELVPGSGVFTNIQSIVADEFAPVTGPSFTPTAAEDGLALRVLARFKDGEGVFETVASGPIGGTGVPVGDGIPVLGTAGDDLLIGTPAADTLFGLGGNDTLVGLANDDILDGGADTDTAVFFGQIADFTFARTPTGTIEIVNNITGEEDEIFNIEFVRIVNGGVVNGQIVGTTLATFTIAQIEAFADGLALPPNNVATNGDDVLVDVANNQFVIDGLGGNDEIVGLDLADQLTGGAGDDILSGGAGNDTLTGGTGSDIIDGGAGNNDRAVFNGPLANFTLSISQAGNILVTDNATADEDEISNVENFVFTGQTLTLAQAQTLAGLVNGTAGANTFNGTAADEAFAGLGGADVINGAGGDDVLLGGNGADTLNGGAGRDGLTGGAGNDVVNGNGENDVIFWSVGDGFDTVDGGAGSDTLEITGQSDIAETIRIFTAAEAVAAGLTAGTSEIVITRTVGNAAATNADRIALVDNVEEIVINGGRLRDNTTAIAGDTVQILGDFTATSLALNTINVNGGRGNDTYDVTGLTSPHRLVVNDKGGDNTFVGGRSQDQFKLLPGTTLADYTARSNADGTTTYSRGSFSLTVEEDTRPTILNGTGGVTPPGSGAGNGFAFTASDIAALKKLVNGQPSNIAEDGASGIRDLEGTGNNVANPGSGAADQPFIRLTDARYGENGSVNPIHAGLDPRTISNIIGDQEANLAKNGAGANIFFMAFGQYVDHGLDFLPKGGNGSISIGSGSDNPADLTRGTIDSFDADGNPQYLNKTSPFVDQNQAYGSTEVVGQLLRESAPAGQLGAKLLAGGQDPSNPDFDLLPTLREVLQHHWDAGTKFTDAAKGINNVTLKTYYPGLIDDAGNFNDAVVNQLNSNFLGSGFQLVGDSNFAINVLDHYVAGDLRANENYTLTSIHTVWARNHNYHVERLLASGFDGTQEELFQAAKIVNEAEYQRVVFTEFTDYLLGGLKGDGQHGHDEYNPNATAQISQEFAAAAYRFGHSQIGQTITILDENGNPKSVNLFDAFLNPTNDPESFLYTPAQLAQFGYDPKPGFEQIGVSGIIGGIVRQPAEEVDVNVVDAARNDLVRIRADLFAFNVARGWDVGLGTLNQVRAGLLASTDTYVSEAVELSDEDLSPYASWDDFQQRNSLSNTVIAQFKEAYPDLVLAPDEIAAFVAANPDIVLVGGNTVKGIDRVDLWVGGLAEKHINDGVVGSTFWVILHEQFDRLQEADRFYYLDRVGDADFYEALKELDFSDIVERNTGLTDLPKDIFSATDDPSDDNQSGEADDEAEDEQEDEDAASDSDTDEDSPAPGDDSGDEVADIEDEDEDEDEDSDIVINPPPAGNGTGSGTSTSPFVIYIGAAVASDTAFGGAGADRLAGGDGDDHLFGYENDDTVLGGDGDDYLDGGDGHDLLFGGAGADVIKGGSGHDEIDGGAGRDVIMAGTGNDVIFIRNNDIGDVIDAGDELIDSDTLDLSAISANITVYLSANGSGSVVAGTTTHTIKGIENVTTGGGDDVIVASSDVNILEGGSGADTFVFNSVNALAQADVITDLNFGQGDTIDLTPLFASLALGDVPLTQGDFSPTGRVRLTTDDVDQSTLVEINADNDENVEFAIRILGRTDIDHKDFGLG